MCRTILTDLCSIRCYSELVFDEVVVSELGKEIAGFDARTASDDELCSAAVTLAELSSSVTTGLRHVLAELDARGVTDREDGLATGSWLAREAKVPKGWARREVNVARKLRRWPTSTRRRSTGGSPRITPPCSPMRTRRGWPTRSWDCRPN